MKKFLLVLIVIISVCTVLTACKGTGDGTKTEILIIAPDGAPALALSKQLKEKKEYENYKITYEIVPGTTNLQARALEADIALVPTNLAAILYNNNQEIKVAGSAVNGILYLIGKTPLTSLNGLKGKVVHCLGEGNTPEFIFRYILNENGIACEKSDTVINSDTVSLKFVTEAQTIIQYMAAGQAEFAVLGEPQVTQALSRVSGFNLLFDLQEEYGGGYPQVSVMMKNSLLTDHKAFADSFIDDLALTGEWAKANASDAQSALTANESKLTGLTAEIITRCNIKFSPSAQAKTAINQYLTVMAGFKAQFVGGKVPDDGFYYIP